MLWTNNLGDYFVIRLQNYLIKTPGRMHLMKIKTPNIGEILKEEFMKPLGISSSELAKNIDIPLSLADAILSNQRKITPDISIKLGKYFNVSQDYFLNLQHDIDNRNK